LNDSISTKQKKLAEILLREKKLLVAFSGGVDSTFLLVSAVRVLGKDNVVAFIERGDVYPAQEITRARRFARSLGVKTVVSDADCLKNPEFVRNSPERCFFCKKDLFAKMQETADTLGIRCLADGSNADDMRDFRPGAKAKRIFGVRSPLEEAGLTKEEIRHLSRKMGLPTWDKPAMACLASRIPYGQHITQERLVRIRKAEEFLRQSGFSQVRVRDHQAIARIEIVPGEFQKAVASSEKIVRRLKGLGYLHVVLDLEGYTTGSMNRALGKKEYVMHVYRTKRRQ
jgi:uncharacterized protein